MSSVRCVQASFFASMVIVALIFAASRGLGRASYAADPTYSATDVAHLPPIEEIDSMIAEVYCHPFADLGGPNFSGFEIRPENFADILRHFEKSRPDTNFRNDVESGEIGTIRINLKGCGSVHCGCVRICWFAVHFQGPLYFSCGGRRYVHIRDHYTGDETLNFDGFIRGLYAKAHPETDPNREDK